MGGGDYTQEILRRLQWENNHYDHEACNWPDLRDAARQGFMHGLCSGAPGVAAARKQLLQYAQDARIRAICEQDLAHVKMYMQRAETSIGRDSLCCGNAARLEGAWLLQQDISAALNAPLAFVHVLNTDDMRPGLFQGLAGAGYVLTHCLPGAHSSLLCWEEEH